MKDPWPEPNRPGVYVDEARFVLRLTSYPTGDPEQITEGYLVWWDEVGVDLDEAAKLASGVAWNHEAGYLEAHVSRQSYSQFEWGASGYGLEFVVDLVNSVAAETVMVGLGYVIARLRGEKKRQWTVDMSDLESLGVDAMRAVAAVFEEDWDDLSVEEVTRTGSLVVVLVHGRVGKYKATVGRLPETGDPYCRVQRR